MRNPGRVLLVLVFVMVTTAWLQGQRRQQRFGAVAALDKEAPNTEFAIARWYSAGWQTDGWMHDYPTAEEHILQVMAEVSQIDTNYLSYKVVDLGSSEIFEYPFSYVSHPGEVV